MPMNYGQFARGGGGGRIMPTIKLHATVKHLFVDRNKIADAVKKHEARGLIRWGALTRKIARGSMKKAPKKAATRGKARGQERPPWVRSPSPNLKDIYFVYEPDTRQTVVGSIRTGSRIRPALPGAIQRGDTVTARRGGRRGYRIEKTRIGRFPYMIPAMDKSEEKLGDIFRDTIRG